MGRHTELRKGRGPSGSGTRCPVTASDEVALNMVRDGEEAVCRSDGSLLALSVLAQCFMFLSVEDEGAAGLTSEPTLFAIGEESLTIFVDKRKLSRKTESAGSVPTVGGSGNSSAVSLETLHQLAASYFIDRESTLRRLHHIQIATGAIKVTPATCWRGQGDTEASV